MCSQILIYNYILAKALLIYIKGVNNPKAT